MAAPGGGAASCRAGAQRRTCTPLAQVRSFVAAQMGELLLAAHFHKEAVHVLSQAVPLAQQVGLGQTDTVGAAGAAKSGTCVGLGCAGPNASSGQRWMSEGAGQLLSSALLGAWSPRPAGAHCQLRVGLVTASPACRSCALAGHPSGRTTCASCPPRSLRACCCTLQRRTGSLGTSGRRSACLRRR